MSEIDRAVAALAGRQHGAVALWQMGEFGVDRGMAMRRCARGVWKAMAPGVYVISGAPRTFHQRLMVAVLYGGPEAMAPHRAGARLRRVAGSMAVPIEVSVPQRRQISLSGVIYHRSSDLALAGRAVVDGIPVTSVARILLDVAAVAPSQARQVMWAGLRNGSLTWETILAVLVEHSRRGRTGIGVVRDLVQRHYLEIAGDSSTEDLAYEILADSGQVPLPQRLAPVVCADGVEVTPDHLWPEYMAVLEVWGVDHFRNEEVQQADALKVNQMRLAGYGVLVYTGKMLRRPDHLLRDVDRLLRSQGWNGRPPGRTT